MLEYSLKQSDILNESRIAFVINVEGVSNCYYERIVKEYKIVESLNQFIYSFENNQKKIVKVANIPNNAGENQYLELLTFYFNCIHDYSGRKISIYLPSVSRFYDLACAAMKYYEKRSGCDYTISIYCDEENYCILGQVFENLNDAIKNRKLEISEFLYKSFTCCICKKFTYRPNIVNCCNLVYCKDCSCIKKNCKRCFREIIFDEQTSIHKLFEEAPFNCPCGEIIFYSDREKHSKNCDVLWYKCSFCNHPLNYKNHLEHFKSSHLSSLILKELF